MNFEPITWYAEPDGWALFIDRTHSGFRWKIMRRDSSEDTLMSSGHCKHRGDAQDMAMRALEHLKQIKALEES